MYKTHEIKLAYEFCDAVLCGDKCFEICPNDRGYQKGDYVIFKPIKDGIKVYHEIIHKTYIITYVLWDTGIENGFVVFGIREAKDELDMKCEVTDE